MANVRKPVTDDIVQAGGFNTFSVYGNWVRLRWLNFLETY